jgi:hypothetical protein
MVGEGGIKRFDRYLVLHSGLIDIALRASNCSSANDFLNNIKV